MIDILPGLNSTASALTAERMRMDVIGQNIANLNVTRGLDGKMPYQRQMVVFESVLQQQVGTDPDTPTEGVRVSRIVKDPRPPKPIWMPEHPHADAQGWVMTPGINMHEEMADYMVASRSFEANLAVVKNARAMALAELSIGKR